MTALSKVEAVLYLLKSLLCQVNSLQVFSFVDIMQGHIVDDKCVEMKFFIFINRVLDGVYGASCGLLLAVE